MAKDNRPSNSTRSARRALTGPLLAALLCFGGTASAEDLVTKIVRAEMGAARGVDLTPLDEACAVPDGSLRFATGMPTVVKALREGAPLRIVALGSSSTEGAGATSPELSYPSRLATELRARFPRSSIEVVNRGIGGQLARQMLERISRDAIEPDPELVIWQTGTNDALALIDQSDFNETLVSGIDRLQEAGIDVMLMDLQFYPRVRKADVYERYVDLMSGVASSERVALFPRYALMRHWAGSEKALWAGDGFHLGNLGYRCVAAVLAEAIERQVEAVQHAELHPPKTVAASE